MIIKEFFPNPVGNDQEGEYIKFFNDSAAAVNLSGWQIKDAAGKSFNLNGELAADQELVLTYFQTKISLNNNGEKLFLYDSTGKLIDELGYSGQASEGQRIIKQQITTIDDKITTNQITNYQFPITSNVIFIDFLTAIILAGLGLYIIMQLEKKLQKSLF